MQDDRDQGEPKLDGRKSAILRAVVQTYIETAQPVGSGHVVDTAGVGVSPATVRNEMTVLEREGYLAQPHTSAGRVPTEKGYRFFVDSLGPGHLGPTQQRQLRAFFSHSHGELERILKNTSRLLADLTATTAVVVGEPVDVATVRSVQLVGLGGRSAIVVAVTSTGSVIKRSVDLPAECSLSDEDVAEISRLLSERVVGRALGDLDHRAPTGRPGFDAVLDIALSALGRGDDQSDRRFFMEGASNIAGAFEATAQLRQILQLLEEQFTVVTLLRDLIDRGLSVAIGSENGMASLAECAVIVAPFSVAGEPVGTIGLLGPTRMNYAETLATVAAVSDRLSKTLTEG